jgi:hypothetical protein
MKLNDEQLAEWNAWVGSRPEKVQESAAKVQPWKDYYLRSTGQRARLLAYAEDGTVRAECWRDDCGPLEILTHREVFGLDPNDFEEVKS